MSNNPENFTSTFALHGIKEIVLDSKWVTEFADGALPADGPYVQQSLTLKGERDTAVVYEMDVSTFGANGIIIEDADEYTLDYSTNEQTGKSTIFIRRKPLEETKEQ